MKECAKNIVLNVVVIKINECSLKTPFQYYLIHLLLKDACEVKRYQDLSTTNIFLSANNYSLHGDNDMVTMLISCMSYT